MANRWTKEEIERGFLESQNGLKPGKDNPLSRSSEFPKFLLLKHALDSGLIKEGIPKSALDFLRTDVRESPQEIFSGGTGGVAVLSGNVDSPTLSVFKGSGSKGKVETSFFNSLSTTRSKSQTPLVGAVLTYSGSPEIIKSAPRGTRIPGEREVTISRRINDLETQSRNSPDPTAIFASIRNLTLGLRYETMVDSGYWFAWLQTPRIVKFSGTFEVREKVTDAEFEKAKSTLATWERDKPYLFAEGFDPFETIVKKSTQSQTGLAFGYEFEGEFFAESGDNDVAIGRTRLRLRDAQRFQVIVDNDGVIVGPITRTTPPDVLLTATSEQIESALKSWRIAGGGQDPTEDRFSKGESHGSFVLLFRVSKKELDKINNIITDERDESKGGGVISDDDFENGTSSSSEIANEITEERSLQQIQFEEETAELERVTRENPGQFIIRDDANPENISYRVSKNSEAQVIQEYITTNGAPSGLLDAQAAGAAFSFNASDVAAVRKEEKDTLETAVIPGAPPPVLEDKETPTNKSFKNEDIVVEDGIADETEYTKEQTKSSTDVVKDTAGFSLDSVKELLSDAVDSAAGTVKGFALKIANVFKEAEARRQKQLAENRNTARRIGQVTAIIPREETHAILRIVRPSLQSDKKNNIDENINGSDPIRVQVYSERLNRLGLKKDSVPDSLEVLMETDNFLLQTVTEVDTEKYQIVETFGEPLIFFYGRRPRLYNFNGVLYNDKNQLWKDLWKVNYDGFLRGTKCVECKARAYLIYDGAVREGFLTQTTQTQTIDPNVVNFSFQMFITREVQVDAGLARQQNTPLAIDVASLEAACADTEVARNPNAQGTGTTNDGETGLSENAENSEKFTPAITGIRLG